MTLFSSELKHSHTNGRKCVVAFFALLLVATAALFPQVASAQVKKLVIGRRLIVSVYQFPKLQVVRVIGGINLGDEGKISDTLSGLIPGKNIRLLLGGFGGGWTPTVQAMRSRLLEVCSPERGCGIESVVQEGRECTSACIVLFMTGQERTAGVTSIFGFHSSYIKVPFRVRVPWYGSNSYLNAGVSSGWLAKNSRLMESDNITYLHGSDLKESNIVTRVIDLARAKTIWSRGRRAY